MYVIGDGSYYGYIAIEHRTLYDGKNIITEIKKVKYKAALNKALTIFADYESAKDTLDEIIKNYDNIVFENEDLIESIVEKNNKFDILSYIKTLQIYELIPTLVSK